MTLSLEKSPLESSATDGGGGNNAEKDCGGELGRKTLSSPPPFSIVSSGNPEAKRGAAVEEWW